MQLSTLIILTSSYVLQVAIAKQCTVDSFPVQANFITERYLGKWYEIKWFSDNYLPTDVLYQDFSNVFTQQSDGNISISTTGRNPAPGHGCFHYHSTLIPTNTTAKFKYDYMDKGRLLDYWIVSTDYVNYAVAYMCFEENADGTCGKAESWILSRHSYLADDKLAKVNLQIEQLCLNTTLFLTTYRTNGCSADPSSVVG
uniref:Retinol-binding protein 4-like isoform X2 n=1 Tax=Crassostrea virginica TaxID=6565 RepID=A0A8B8E2D0_CRAVI|nr:retinol-binding protein 4-like isoform X2 [Crassostrea virginica]